MILYSHLVYKVGLLEKVATESLPREVGIILKDFDETTKILKDILRSLSFEKKKNVSDLYVLINNVAFEFFQDERQIFMIGRLDGQEIKPALQNMINKITDAGIREKYFKFLREINEIIPDIAVVSENDGSSSLGMLDEIQTRISQIEHEKI